MKYVLPVVVSVTIVSAVALHAQQKPAAQKPTAVQKTAWGDPDISGVWTSDAAIGIPLQRPDRFNGRAELTDEEFKEKEANDARTRNRAENAIGSFRNDNAWLTRTFRQTSLIIDPPDGRAPALVAGAEKRRTPQGDRKSVV